LIIFLLISRIYSVGLKFLNLEGALLWEILFYIICAGGSDIDRQKFVWDNLFRKSGLEKEYWCKNLVVSNSDTKKKLV
jgi:hypothetical protein